MSNTVVVVTNDTIEKMKQHYHSFLVNAPSHALFMAKKGNVTITAYRSGKVLFQGGGAENEASPWKSEGAIDKKKTTTVASSNIPSSLLQSSHIGTDEAGTGDYFGPITVAAVYIKQASINLLKEIGIADSKVLKDQQISELAKEIVSQKIPYSLLTLDNVKYNKLQRKGWNQGKIKAMLHHHSIEKLLVKIKGMPLDGILIDQFCEPHVYKRYIGSEKLSLHDHTYFMTKAESHSISVAAASIIARAKFVKEMDALSNKLGITIPKGASRKVDETAAYIMKKYDEDVLASVAKLHFGNTQKAKKYM
ncbi:ribonuclease HIII [Gracilibacillus halotolerans]|uniref:Ribonuclease HIII n=1 Tax=Gracilibacillus halotolerans TaxID=74386 RepID=A0A841RQI2_9BACI|nr:ribonuclease HIII [Gracilibacillus halotolerans]MBB6513873.1 ribonuclease HIII [Gracilibacillus halotolerans]